MQKQYCVPNNGFTQYLVNYGTQRFDTHAKVARASRSLLPCANQTSNSGFDRTFMPCSGYSLSAAEQQAGYQIPWVNLQREAKMSVNL